MGENIDNSKNESFGLSPDRSHDMLIRSKTLTPKMNTRYDGNNFNDAAINYGIQQEDSYDKDDSMVGFQSSKPCLHEKSAFE